MTESYDSTADTQAHRDKVKRFMDTLALEIINRAVEHDESKLGPEEKPIFDKVTPRLKSLTYGSNEYKASLADMGEALMHHYRVNRHHPEHFAGWSLRPENPHKFAVGVRGMTIVDILEMFCDWSAATMRHEDGDICGSIKHNMERFDLGEVLACVFMNTAQHYQMGRGGHRGHPKWSTPAPKE